MGVKYCSVTLIRRPRDWHWQPNSEALIKELYEGLGGGINKCLTPHAVFKKYESRHSLDVEIIAELGELIYVDFGEVNLLVLFFTGMPR